jgi:hypothetical protein
LYICSCWSQKNGPGRILTQFVNGKEPGAYQICGGAPERYDISDPRYFVKHPNLAWVQTTGAEAQNVPGVIKTGAMNHLVARVHYFTANGTYQTIGKVQDSTVYYYKPGDAGETKSTGAFEVLTCQPSKPVIQCGTLLSLGANDITKLGFPSGTYTDGSVSFV